jgi:hypothetical protein
MWRSLLDGKKVMCVVRRKSSRFYESRIGIIREWKDLYRLPSLFRKSFTETSWRTSMNDFDGADLHHYVLIAVFFQRSLREMMQIKLVDYWLPISVQDSKQAS